MEDLQDRIGHQFADPQLLVQALTHRSWFGNRKGQVEDYQRLEFLGDSLLGYIIAERLWRDDDHSSEGQLTRRRAYLVRRETLANAASRLQIGDAVRMSTVLDQTGGRERPSLLADTFEAVAAAIYIDGGIDAVRVFVLTALEEELQEVHDPQVFGKDWKTMLQEKIQAERRITPTYRIVSETGPAHQKLFAVEVLVEGKPAGSGRGSTLKSAEQQAAMHALGETDETK